MARREQPVQGRPRAASAGANVHGCGESFSPQPARRRSPVGLPTDAAANMTAEADVTVVDWDSFDLEEFTRELRGNLSGPDADKLIWAFEHAVEVARTDDDLLSYLVVAIICLLARLDESSPRTVLEAFFRRSVSDEAWRRTYLPLFA
jgi:hypothetical protein